MFTIVVKNKCWYLKRLETGAAELPTEIGFTTKVWLAKTYKTEIDAQRDIMAIEMDNYSIINYKELQIIML